MEFVALLDAFPALLFSLTAALGLCVGSFLNVVIHRLPIMMERRWQMECADLADTETVTVKTEPYNLCVPKSSCPACNTPIAASQNIPVLSWLILRGRCANCQAKISPQYPAVEVLTAVLSVIVVAHFGATIQSVTAIVFTWSLVALSAIDFKTTLLPDDITLPLLWLGLLTNTFTVFTDLQSAVIGATAGYLILWSVYQAFKLITGKEGMGYGDFKLLAAMGAWLGWQQLPLIVLLSSLLGAVVGIGLIIVRGRDRNIPIPFGPYLAGAGWIAMLWGEQIMHYYLQYAA
jgi:leader peptidase (prepilin peptidase)/N-methyltransferase